MIKESSLLSRWSLFVLCLLSRSAAFPSEFGHVEVKWKWHEASGVAVVLGGREWHRSEADLEGEYLRIDSSRCLPAICLQPLRLCQCEAL